MQTYRRGLFLGGSLLAVALAAFLLGGSSGPPAVAQPPAAAGGAAAGRYQMTSFVLQNLTPGAYILDTQTGEVFQVVGCTDGSAGPCPRGRYSAAAVSACARP